MAALPQSTPRRTALSAFIASLLGGLLCLDHRQGTRVSPEAVAMLQDILGGRLATALEQPASPATHEVDQLATRVMEHHLERRLRSVGLLE